MLNGSEYENCKSSHVLRSTYNRVAEMYGNAFIKYMFCSSQLVEQDDFMIASTSLEAIRAITKPLIYQVHFRT